MADLGLVSNFVKEFVVPAPVLHHQLGLGDQQLVLGRGFIGVRILAGLGDDRTHVDLVTTDCLDHIPIDVGRGHYLNGIS